jgi:asparagine synthase (glutamine-hydrolysing)
MGFGVRVGDWMRGSLRPWVEDVIFSPRSLKRGYFDPDALRQFVWTRLNGRREQSFDLWALLWLELWHQEFMD